MSSLERMLQAVARAGGHSVRLLPGRNLVIVTRDGDREAHNTEQTTSGIEKMLTSDLGSELRRALSGARGDFQITFPLLGTVFGQIDNRPSGVEASFFLPDAQQDKLGGAVNLKLIPIAGGKAEPPRAAAARASESTVTRAAPPASDRPEAAAKITEPPVARAVGPAPEEVRPREAERGRSFDPDKRRPPSPERRRDYEPERGRPPYEPDRRRPYEPERGRPYEPQRPRDFDYDRGRVYEEDRGRVYEDDRGRDYGRDRGRDYGPDYRRPYEDDRSRDYEPDYRRPPEGDRARDDAMDRRRARDTDERRGAERPRAREPEPELGATGDLQGSGVTAGTAATAEMDKLLVAMLKNGASDLHLSANAPPMIRKDGEMMVLPQSTPLSAAQTARILWGVTPKRNRDEFERRHDTDFAYEMPDRGRFRCNMFLDRHGVGGVLRIIPNKIPTIEEMGLPEDILRLCHLPKGLVLVTGPTGSGKSTTLAALIDYINRHRSSHIITIEDPIEFVHLNKKCLINQRQVGPHTDSFKDALRAALREDPDIILVGEMRDLETIAIAIETAETGHLVFGTLHTSTAPSTVDRIIDQFPADRQSQVRVMLSESLRGVISQILCKKIGGGRVPALEVLMGVPAVANLIRESKVFQIPSIMQTGKKIGMRLMNESLLELVKGGTVDPYEALSKTTDRGGLVALFQQHNIVLKPEAGAAPARPGTTAVRGT